MSPELLKVEEQALLLPPEDREALVERLLGSLGQEALPEIDPAWIAEAERRYREATVMQPTRPRHAPEHTELDALMD